MYKVALLESQVTFELPHLSMALLHADLKQRPEVDVRPARVGLDNTAAALDFIEEGRFDLVAMDCRFPVAFPSQIKERLPAALVLVGGLGYYNMLTKGRADFAVTGPGRLALHRLIDLLTGRPGARIEDVPNLFYWVDRPTAGVGPGSGPIDYSGLDVGYDLQQEMEPFNPDFDFPLVGMETQQELTKTTSVAPPAVVAEFGCPHKGFKLADSLPRPDLEPAEAVFTERGRQKIISIMDERWKGGCSFCVYQKAPIGNVRDTVDLLMSQVAYLQSSQGFTSFSVQSEGPFRFLIPFIERLVESDITVDQLFIRGRAASFHRQRAKLERAVEIAREASFALAGWQIGYESFCQPQLDLYNKGTKAEENLSVVRFTRELAREHPEHYLNLTTTHGMILFNPWTTFDMLREDFEVIRQYLPERLVQSPVIGSTLELFDPFLPLYQKIRMEGLLRKNDHGTDDFRMADPSMEIVRQAIRQSLIIVDETMPPAVRPEVPLLAPVIDTIFAAILDRLEAQYFKPGAGDAAWHETVAPEDLDDEIRRRVKAFMAVEDLTIRDNLGRQVVFISAVNEIVFFGRHLLGEAGDPPVIEGDPGPKVEDLLALTGPWDFEVRNYAQSTVLVDKRTNAMNPVDRVTFALIQIKFQGMDMPGILAEVLRRDPALAGVIRERIAEATNVLAATAHPVDGTTE
jgi:hypothetical protein